MHFRSLLTVELPEIKPDPQWEKVVADKIAFTTDNQGNTLSSKVMNDIFIENMNNISTAFGRELTLVIREVMERYSCETENPKYLEFDDMTESLLKEYYETVDCIKLPNGKIVELCSASIWDKFVIQDGKVYQKNAGPLHHPKRTKKAKRMQAMLGYPRQKIYKTFDNYISQESYAVLNKETGKYGEWYNPNSVYDWYSIGGRWPAMFLVKEDCKEYSYGECGLFNNEKYPAPEGYFWVCAARKKDIQWDMMRQWLNDQATKRFKKLEAMFISGEKDDTVHMITENGIISWGELIYRKGETLEEYLAEYGIPNTWKYPFSVHDIFSDDLHLTKDSYEYYDSEKKQWKDAGGWIDQFQDYVDDAEEDTVFVGIDYHI